jgi:hypothetical protein
MQLLWILTGTTAIFSNMLIDDSKAQYDLARGYDFPEVVREFAAYADWIVFFFDPTKHGTNGESLRIFTNS